MRLETEEEMSQWLSEVSQGTINQTRAVKLHEQEFVWEGFK